MLFLFRETKDDLRKCTRECSYKSAFCKQLYVCKYVYCNTTHILCNNITTHHKPRVVVYNVTLIANGTPYGG